MLSVRGLCVTNVAGTMIPIIFTTCEGVGLSLVTSYPWVEVTSYQLIIILIIIIEIDGVTQGTV